MKSLPPFYIFSIIALSGCLNTTPPDSLTGPEALFDPQVTELTLEIDYTGEDAAPSTGLTQLRQIDPWSLTEDNLRALFGDAVTINVPNELDEMQDIGDQPEGEDQEYSSKEILEISSRTRDQQPTATSQSLHIIFVDGYFKDSEGVRKENVLGVSIGDTGVIAMFKPVIAGGTLEKFVEQTTLIHEIGHAAGLVNNGIDMEEDHHDEEHGAHCTNQDCVMYYQNEGLADLRDFITRYQTKGTTVLFDANCIQDTRAARGE